MNPVPTQSESIGADEIATTNPFLGNELGIGATPRLLGAEVADRTTVVRFAAGPARAFHHQWLRHCCYCAACGNPADGIRFATVISFERDVAPHSVIPEPSGLTITWDDGHRSHYGADWLWYHAYDDDGRFRRASWRPSLWRSELADDFPTVEWSDLEQDTGRMALYERLRDFGIVRVTGVGTEPAMTERLASLIGPIHETTVYGRIYDVKAEPVAKLGAKTGMPQAPHIDDAFTYSPPGIDVFHCLVNTDVGGRSTYVDGFAIAEAIADEDPDAYDALTRLPISHVRRHPDEVDFRHRGPLISLDEFGRPRGIRYFDRALAPLDVEPDDVDRLYDAIRAFNQRMVSAEFMAELRVAPGDGVFIDNHRVLHGRTGFDPASGRHIRLCHVPRDEFHARWRELAHRLAPADHDLHLPQGST